MFPNVNAYGLSQLIKGLHMKTRKERMTKKLQEKQLDISMRKMQKIQRQMNDMHGRLLAVEKKKGAK